MKIEEMKKINYGFIVNAEQLDEVIAQNPMEQVLVRCGGRRFVCAAVDVRFMMDAVEAKGDYVRDLSFPA